MKEKAGARANNDDNEREDEIQPAKILQKQRLIWR